MRTRVVLSTSRKKHQGNRTPVGQPLEFCATWTNSRHWRRWRGWLVYEGGLTMNLSITFTFRESDCDSRRTSDKNFKHTKIPWKSWKLDSPGFLHIMLEDFRSLLCWANWVRQNISQVITERRNNHADAKRAVESRKGAIYSDDFDHPYGCELRLS